MNLDPIQELVELHASTVVTRLRHGELEQLVFEGDVTGKPDRYVNVFHDTGRWTSHDYAETSIDLEVTFTIHSVGTSRWQATWGSGFVMARLFRHVPTIPGRRCFRITHAGSQPVALDRDATPPKHFAVDRLVLRSIPA